LYFAILSLVECLFLSGIRLFFPHAVDFFYPGIPLGVSDTQAEKMPPRQQNDFEGSTREAGLNLRANDDTKIHPLFSDAGLKRDSLRRCRGQRESASSGLASAFLCAMFPTKCTKSRTR
jgi:hypothetical protein